MTPKESSAKRHVFSFSKTRKTPSYSKDDGNAAVMKKAVSLIYQKKNKIDSLMSFTFLIVEEVEIKSGHNFICIFMVRKGLIEIL